MDSRKRRKQRGKPSRVRRNFRRSVQFKEHICFCLQENPESPIKRLACCRQRTHEVCLNRWLDQSRYCPFCRSPVIPDFVQAQLSSPLAFIFSPEFDRVRFLEDYFPLDAIPPPFSNVIRDFGILENFEEWEERLLQYYNL